MIKSLKNQKGAISLFAVLSIMFFIAFMIGAYRIVSANNSMQITSLTNIKERYMKTDEDVKKYYNKIVSSDKRIPISSYEDFKQIGTKNSIIYNGKVYYCGDDKNYTYYFTNDIAFDLDKAYDTKSGKLITAKGDFIPPSVKLQTHLADSETTYKIEPGQYDIVYYKNNEKYKLLVFQNGSYTKIDKDADIADETNNKEYYGALKSYSDIVGSDKDKYKTSDGKYSYLLMYNIPNVSELLTKLGDYGVDKNKFPVAMTNVVENKGFFSPGLYMKWEQKGSVLSDTVTDVDIKTEGDINKDPDYNAVNINGVGINPRMISQIHYPETIKFNILFWQYTLKVFNGIHYDGGLGSLNTSFVQLYAPIGSYVYNPNFYPIGYKSNSGSITIFSTLSNDLFSFTKEMTATKVMLFAKIYDK